MVHIPFRFGLVPKNVRALFSKVVDERPGPDGKPVPCETWYACSQLSVLLCGSFSSDRVSFFALLVLRASVCIVVWAPVALYDLFIISSFFF